MSVPNLFSNVASNLILFIGAPSSKRIPKANDANTPTH